MVGFVFIDGIRQPAEQEDCLISFDEALKEIDTGIKGIVLFLRKHGYKTFMSCQGGEGHSFKHPTVGMQFTKSFISFRKKLIALLFKHNFASFTIEHATAYGGKPETYWEAVYLKLHPRDIGWEEKL